MPALFCPRAGQRAHRHRSTVLIALLVAGLLTGCGQKGALYLPGEASPTDSGRRAVPATMPTPTDSPVTPASTESETPPATAPSAAPTTSTDEGAQHVA